MKNKIKAFFNNTMLVTGIPALYPIYKCSKECLSDIDRPMRIAITGMIKTGKSTLMNSFMKQYIVPTAVEVLTYNVNWFHHISYSPTGREGIIVHLHNGTQESYEISELFSCVKFSPENKEYLDSIHWVDVYIDNPILQKFDLIDTPGLGSLVGTESQHTRDLLTKDENRPDAIVYLMKKGIKNSDIGDVRRFHDATGLMSGINTVAAFSRVDELNGAFNDAKTIIQDNIMANSEVRYYFSRIFPIAALMAEASVSLSDQDVESLIELSKQDDIQSFLFSKDKFTDKTPYLSREVRSNLCSKLSISGIRNIVDFIKNSNNISSNAIKDYLYEYSRVEDLRQYLVNHFGDRAVFIITQQCLFKLKITIQRCLQSKDIIGDNRRILLSINKELSSFIATFEEEFKPYYILSDFYNESDYFDDETWDRARKVLGEFGDDDLAKFGITSSDNRASAIKSEKEFWQNVAINCTHAANSKGADIAMSIAKLVS